MAFGGHDPQQLPLECTNRELLFGATRAPVIFVLESGMLCLTMLPRSRYATPLRVALLGGSNASLSEGCKSVSSEEGRIGDKTFSPFTLPFL